MPTAARKPTDYKRPAASKTTKSPQGEGGFNLDELEYSGPSGDFRFTHAGQEFYLESAATVDVNTLSDMYRDPQVFFAQVMNEEDHARFRELAMPAWKMTALLTAYADFYDLGN